MQNDDLLANVTEVAGSKVLPPCVIMGRLGRGGMGAVYRARHLNLAIDVAVKVLKPQLVSDDPTFVQRFKREGQSAAAISHQNVIRVFDVAEHAELHYIIMELVVGETARQRVDRRKQLPVDEAMQILLESANGLGAAHALGIVHRDIKPDNLLISHDGKLKVADLGLAKPTMGGGGASLMSTANQVMGTPAYMPPEQWESPAVGPAADVWALGATAWFLLAGRDAFDSRDGNYPRVMKQIVLQPFPDLRQLRSDVPDAVIAVLAKATAKEAKDRYADANEFAAAIEALRLPRVSLRDDTDTAEAKTMVSPPLKNLDQIKQWLREDNLTRMQTPPGSRPRVDGALATPPSPPGSTPILTPVLQTPPPTGGTAVDAAPRRRRTGFTAGVAIVAVAAVGWLVFGRGGGEPNTPPVENGGTNGPADPLAGIRALEELLKFEDALAALDKVVAVQPSREDKPLRARLLAGASRARNQQGQFGKALVQVQEAARLDAQWMALQNEVRNGARDAAQRQLVVEAPLGKVKRDAPVAFEARLDLDGVVRLALGSQKVEPRDGGRFTASLPANLREITIGVEFVDGHVATLQPLPIAYEELPPRVLTFRKPLTAQKAAFVDGIAFTAEAALEVAGQLSESDCQLLCDDQPVATTAGDGTFTARLPIATSGEVVALRVVATKNGCTPQSAELRAVRLPAPPPFTIAPVAKTDRLTTQVVVTAGLGTASAAAKVGPRTFPLARDTAKPGAFAGDITLAKGDNTVEVTTTDVLGRTTPPQTVSVRSEITAAVITSVTLRSDGAERPAPNGSTQWVRVDASSFAVTATGAGVTILANGEALPAGTTLGVSSLTEGKPKRFTFRAQNELGGVDWTVDVVLDTRKPVVTVVAPQSGSIVAPQQPTLLRGGWEDGSGLRSLQVDGKDVAFDAKASSGTWSIELPGRGPGAAAHRITATDGAGNPMALDHAFEVGVLGQGGKILPLQRFAGFRSIGDVVNDIGYPKRIVHEATKIELIAAGLENGRRPRLYVGRRLVTAGEFDGIASDAPKLGMPGTDIYKWLRARGAPLDLPTRDERNAITGSPDFDAPANGTTEWAKPAKWTDDSWPLVNSTSSVYDPSTALRSFGFRVAFRP